MGFPGDSPRVISKMADRRREQDYMRFDLQGFDEEKCYTGFTQEKPVGWSGS
jgi:hypothetical protein